MSTQRESLQKDWSIFLKHWFQSPLKIGAWVPSSAATSKAIARCIDPHTTLPVLELGGGTGSITNALLETGIAPSLLYTLEQQVEFCDLLRDRFPTIHVLQGDAMHFGSLLQDYGVEQLSMVVSSLPIVWFPIETQRAIVNQAFSRMGPQGRFIQMTNMMRSPLPRKELGITGRIVDYVWQNLPPCFIWSYQGPSGQTAQKE